MPASSPQTSWMRYSPAPGARSEASTMLLCRALSGLETEAVVGKTSYLRRPLVSRGDNGLSAKTGQHAAASGYEAWAQESSSKNSLNTARNSAREGKKKTSRESR